jgi:hypothetical protein
MRVKTDLYHTVLRMHASDCSWEWPGLARILEM